MEKKFWICLSQFSYPINKKNFFLVTFHRISINNVLYDRGCFLLSFSFSLSPGTFIHIHIEPDIYQRFSNFFHWNFSGQHFGKGCNISSSDYFIEWNKNLCKYVCHFLIFFIRLSLKQTKMKTKKFRFLKEKTFHHILNHPKETLLFISYDKNIHATYDDELL